MFSDTQHPISGVPLPHRYYDDDTAPSGRRSVSHDRTTDNDDPSSPQQKRRGGGGCRGRFDYREWFRKYFGRAVVALLAVSLIGLVFGLMPYLAVHEAVGGKFNGALYYSAGFFVLVTVPVSVHGIVQHLVYFYVPQVQKFVVRILFMVPIFSIEAWLSLFFHGTVVYLRAFRELYEAFVISSFVYYVIELLGGEDRLAEILRTKHPSYGEHKHCCSLVFRDWEMGRRFMNECKYGVLQYVAVKTLTTVVTVVLQAKGLFKDGVWSWDSGFAYVSVLLNMSIGWALYCLVKLYYATKDDLREWRPVGKFLCIKLIIFFTFWQGFLISLLTSAGVIGAINEWDSAHVADGIQDTLICFEMVIFAFAHRWAFPYTDYVGAGRQRGSNGATLPPQDESALLQFDEAGVAHNVDPDRVDADYVPPTVSQLHAPLSVKKALWGSVVPDETFTDIARMGLGRGGAGASRDDELVFSMEQAERI